MSGDRHLRPDPEGRLGGRPPRPASVRVTADPDHAGTVAGQHLLAMLVHLLARQFEIVETISNDIESTPARAEVFRAPRIGAGELTEALIELGRRVGASSIVTTAGGASSPPTVRIHLGAGWDPTSESIPALAVAVDGWVLSARSTAAIAGPVPRSSNPFAAQLAACVAAGFAFKSAFERQTPVDVALDLWPEPDPPEPSAVSLPPAYVLGLGAVGAAFGYALSSAPGLRGVLMGIDPQTMSDTDRNRLVSGTADDRGEPKAALFMRLFGQPEFTVGTFAGKWPRDYIGDAAREVPAALRADEDDGRFRWIISCVDRDTDRADIAARLPRHVLSGSTYGMAAQIISYSLDGPCECLACRHRRVRPVSVEQTYAHLRSLTVGEREAWYDERGANPSERAAIETYLGAGDPSCATPGAADLVRLGVQGAVDWAVGFVSVAAGVLLAVRFIRAAVLGERREIERGSEWRLFFWRDELDIHRARRASDCPICSGPQQDAWRALWDLAQSDQSRDE